MSQKSENQRPKQLDSQDIGDPCCIKKGLKIVTCLKVEDIISSNVTVAERRPRNDVTRKMVTEYSPHSEKPSILLLSEVFHSLLFNTNSKTNYFPPENQNMEHLISKYKLCPTE